MPTARVSVQQPAPIWICRAGGSVTGSSRRSSTYRRASVSDTRRNFQAWVLCGSGAWIPQAIARLIGLCGSMVGVIGSPDVHASDDLAVSFHREFQHHLILGVT